MLYKGEWNESTNLPHGRGLMYTQQGIYEGHFKNGEPYGHCRLINAKLCIEGDFITVIPSSKSMVTITWREHGHIFQGYANASDLTQKGTLSLSTGEVLFGQFKYQETTKHGVVKSIDVDGSVHIGEWRDNQLVKEIDEQTFEKIINQPASDKKAKEFMQTTGQFLKTYLDQPIEELGSKVDDINAMIEIWQQAKQGLQVNMISDSDNEKLWREAFNLYERVQERYEQRRDQLLEEGQLLESQTSFKG